jgi:hypothetical protein
MTALQIPSTIPPLIHRHVEDAAFYWSQHDASVMSARLRLPGLDRFSLLLAAHLEGLEVAGSAAYEPAFRALERWKKPGEAFVAAYVAFISGADECSERLWAVVRRRPDQLLRGAVSALAWLPARIAHGHVRTLSGSASCPVQRVAALRAAALPGCSVRTSLAQPLRDYLLDDDCHVRAAAWRLAGESAGDAVEGDAVEGDALAAATDDAALAVRAECAIACARRHARPDRHDPRARWAAEQLLACITAQAGIEAAATGWARTQAARRLARWLQWLAVLLPVGHAALPELVPSLPVRARFAFLAAHGDPAWLRYVVGQMEIDASARLAGWAWQTLTGVDLASAGLVRDDEAASPRDAFITEALPDSDVGLPYPDAGTIGLYPLPAFTQGERYLLGRPVSPGHALQVLGSASQPVRSIARHHLSLRVPDHGIALRAAASVQARAMHGLAARLEQEAGR